MIELSTDVWVARWTTCSRKVPRRKTVPSAGFSENCRIRSYFRTFLEITEYWIRLSGTFGRSRLPCAISRSPFSVPEHSGFFGRKVRDPSIRVAVWKKWKRVYGMAPHNVVMDVCFLSGKVMGVRVQE